jgi:hypothetical protein
MSHGGQFKNLGLSSPGHAAAVERWAGQDDSGVVTALLATGVNESGVVMTFSRCSTGSGG